MPRTRVNKKKGRGSKVAMDGDEVSSTTPDTHASKQKHADSDLLSLQTFQREFDDRKCKLDHALRNQLESMDRSLQVLLLQIPAEELNRPPSSAQDVAKLVNASLSTDFDGPGLISSTVNKHAGKGKKRSAATMAAPAPPPPAKAKTSTRPSRARTSRALAAEKEKSLTTSLDKQDTQTEKFRSASRARDATLSPPPLDTGEELGNRRLTRSRSLSRARHNSTSIMYTTPLASKTTSRLAPPITPKVDPYGPIPLKRQPRGGEMAISMTGSPLMVNQGNKEPNISVPVNDEVYCIMATNGPCPTINDIDNDTKQKLRQLRANLDQILGDV